MRPRWAFALAFAALAAHPARPQEAGPRDETDGPDAILQRVRVYLERHGDHGRIDPERRLAETRREYERRRGPRPLTVSLDNWVSVGPTNGAGRMIALAPHPTITGTLFAGAAGGGAWKTADGGASWTPLTDGISDLSVGALAVAPSDPTVIYLGSGEGGYAIDFIPGIGLLKSTDGGGTWMLPASVLATQFYRISVHPSNPLELVLGTNAGAFRSTDGGTTFASVIASATYRNVTEIVRHPTNPLTMYAATWCGFSCPAAYSHVLKSTDGGVTWVDKSAGLPTSGPNPLYERLSLAIAPTNPLVLYAATSLKVGSAAAVSHVYKTTDGGDTWNDLPAVSGSASFNSFMAEQAWYDNTIVVSPANENVVVAAGTYYIRSIDGGATWASVGGGAHVDAHDLRFQGGTLWVANDGGVWTSTDNLSTAASRNATLVTRQFYAVAIDPVNVNRVIAGAQDNGTAMRQDAGGTTWTSVIGGDGFECAINPTNGSIAYGTVQYGAIYRTLNAGAPFPSFGSVTPPYPSGESGPFLSNLTLDASSPSTLYTGTYRVWRTVDGGTTWAPLPTATTDGSTWTGTSASSIAVARSNGQVLMVAKGSGLYRSTDGGSTWALKATGLPGAGINNVEVDPTDPLTAYVALATTSGSSVYRTTDGGTSWGVRSSGLPRFSAQVVRVDPTDRTDLFAGTDVGVYRSRDSGASWALFGSGLPASSAQDIRISDDGTLVRLGTHGRGAWELRSGTTAAPGFYSVVPCRILDTRNAAGTYGGPALVPNVARAFPLSGQCGVPSDAKAVVVNFTVTNVASSGSLKVFPTGATEPVSTVMSVKAGRTRANNGLLLCGTPNLSVTAIPEIPSGSLDFILDVSGYLK